MKTITILVPIRLAGQDEPRESERGYAMAALLIAMSIMAVMMTVVMPVWKHAAQREKEEELVFRGQQYARAIGLFQRKFANAYPPNIDVLVDQKFLRKKFKDPITNDDFVPLPVGQGAGAAGAAGQRGAQPAGQRGATPAGRGTTPGTVGQQPAPDPARRRASRRVAHRNSGRGRRDDSGHQRCQQQEQSAIDSPL